jgi:hypothetical protein
MIFTGVLEFVAMPIGKGTQKKMVTIPLKVHKHEIFVFTFFAETETIWSTGPVT